MNWSRYNKKPKTKTVFELCGGEAPFYNNLNLLEPIYIRRGSPSFSLVSRGKHISALFKLLEGIYSGDYKRNLLIVLFNGEGDGFELIMTDLPKSEGQKLLEKGELNSLIERARYKARNV